MRPRQQPVTNENVQRRLRALRRAPVTYTDVAVVPYPRFWPNTEVHLYQDCQGLWRARISISVDGAQRIVHVPSREKPGMDTRVRLLLATEVVIDGFARELAL